MNLQERAEAAVALADEATPGPWKYDDGITSLHNEPEERGKSPLIQSTSMEPFLFGCLIAEAYGDVGGQLGVIPSLQQMDANGHLIAAAHDHVALIRELSAALAAAEAERDALRKIELTDKQVRSACLSYRHDYGLMDAKAQAHLEFQCREWCHAISKEPR